MKINLNAALVGLAVMGMGATAASAAIQSVTGATNWLGSPPVSCLGGVLTGPIAYTWDEQQNVSTTGVFCDMLNNPGSSGSPVAGTIAGAFDSHFITYEDYSGLPGVTGSITFKTQIIGVIFVNTSLDNTDATFGWGGTLYPTTNPVRGLNSMSSFTINGSTLTFNLSTLSPVYEFVQIRVLTHPVPTPGGMAVLGLGGLAACRRRRAV